MTGLEILILAAIFIGAAASALLWETHHTGRTPQGVIPLFEGTAQKTLVIAGEVNGYWIQDGTAGGIPVSFPRDPRPGIDGISVPVQLLVGSDPLDMGTVSVAIESAGASGVLLRDDRRPVGRSSWTIAWKSGVLPLHHADADDLLEPGEMFGLLVVTPGPLGPGEQVTITLSPAGGIPLVVKRGIPPRVSPVTLLSL